MIVNKKIQSLIIISFCSIAFIVAAWYMYQGDLQRELEVETIKPGTLQPVSYPEEQIFESRGAKDQDSEPVESGEIPS